MSISESVVIKNKPDYVFDVDGEDFPWFVSEAGPRVARVGDNLFTITVEIFCIDKEDSTRWLTVVGTGPYGHELHIGGMMFPWTLTNKGYTLNSSWGAIPMVTLAFYSRSVDYEGHVEDQRLQFDIDGNVVS